MKALILLLILISSCEKNRSVKKESKSVEQLISELDSTWSLRDNYDELVDQIKDSPLLVNSFDFDSETAHLDRVLTGSEISKGSTLSQNIANLYKTKTGKDYFLFYYNKYIENDLRYVNNCNINSTPHSMISIDGVSRTIKGSASSYFIEDWDLSIYKSGFTSFWSACRYLSSDMIAKSYNNHLINVGVEILFPVKYKANGGIGGVGRVQSLHGSMILDFCSRSFKNSDGLDILNLCL